MRYTTLVVFFMASCFALNCEESPVTGSEDVVELQNMSVQVDTTYAFGDQFVAEGTIRNNNSSTVTPRWFLEMSVF